MSLASITRKIEYHTAQGRTVGAYATRYDDGTLKGYWLYISADDGYYTISDGFCHTARDCREYATALNVPIVVERRTR